MESVLSFFVHLVPEIGLVPSVILLFIGVLTIVFYRMNQKKDEMLKELVDQQNTQSKQAIEAVKMAIVDIKEVSLMSLNEVSSLSGKVEGIIGIVRDLMIERQAKVTKEVDKNDN